MIKMNSLNNPMTSVLFFPAIIFLPFCILNTRMEYQMTYRLLIRLLEMKSVKFLVSWLLSVKAELGWSSENLIMYFVRHLLNSYENTRRVTLTISILMIDRIAKLLSPIGATLSSSLSYFIAVIGQCSDSSASSQSSPALYGTVTGLCLSVVLNIYFIIR